MLLAVGVLVALSVVAYFGRNKLKIYALTARYEAIYWVLGMLGVGNDTIYFWKDKLAGLPNRSGDVAIVTGGSRGIGYHVVRRLLLCDMHVIIGCRNTEAGQKAVESIRHSGVTSGSADVLALDTASLKSVKEFAANVLSKTSTINILVNNAGIMFVPYTLTEDGFESQLAVNYMGHFLLSHLLLPTLKESGRKSGRASRIVNVSSCGHLAGSINFDDIHYQKSIYIASEAYAQSKLAQLMFTIAADRELRQQKAPVLCFAVHPGVVDTELFNGTPLKTIMPWAPRLFFKTPEQGSTSIVHACIADTLEKKGGAYIANCMEMWTSSYAQDKFRQQKLMSLTEDMLGITNSNFTE